MISNLIKNGWIKGKFSSEIKQKGIGSSSLVVLLEAKSGGRGREKRRKRREKEVCKAVIFNLLHLMAHTN